jgi:dTDP-glucose 4,6-dehydratase
VNGIYKLLFSDYHYPVNLGNPEEITIIEFAQEILKLTKSDQKIDFRPLPVGDPLKRQPDISLAKKELIWKPTTTRSDGMKKTFEYFSRLPKEKLYKTDHKDFSKHIKI